MLVRRLNEAAVEEWHRLRAHVLMDAGELGSRNLSVTWVTVPGGAFTSIARNTPSFFGIEDGSTHCTAQ